MKDFQLYLKKYNLNITNIREKLKIESLWNELIYKKFNPEDYYMKFLEKACLEPNDDDYFNVLRREHFI